MKDKKEKTKTSHQRHFGGEWSEDGQTFYLDGQAYRVKLGRVLPNGNQELKTYQIKEKETKDD